MFGPGINICFPATISYDIMAKDNQILVRVNDPTDEAIESFAEKHDYTKAEAVRRMVEDRLAGEGHMGDNRAVPDGGQILNRIEAVEKSQQNRLDEIDRKVEENLEKEPSWIEQQIQAVQISSVGLTLAGAAVYLLSLTNLTSIEGSLAYGLMAISAVVAFLSMAIGDVIK
jgi:hypothetical protein